MSPRLRDLRQSTQEILHELHVSYDLTDDGMVTMGQEQEGPWEGRWTVREVERAAEAADGTEDVAAKLVRLVAALDVRREAEATIRALDQALAPGSETAWLAEALDALRCAERRGKVATELAWWRGAYRMIEWAREHGIPDETVSEWLRAGDDLTGWTPGAAAYRAAREAIGSQAHVARLLGVDVMTISRRERGETVIPSEAWIALRAVAARE